MPINRQLLITCAALLTSILFFEFTDMDIFLQDYLYNFESGKWIIDSKEPISKFLLYDGIRVLYVVLLLLALGVRIFLRKKTFLQPFKQGLLIVCISLVLIPAVVNIAKVTTNIPCPKDLIHYDGDYPPISLFDSYPENFEQENNIRCYPAGHASGGFALMSLFFLFNSRRAQTIALASSMTLAWTVGFYKIGMGDHFLSHTITTMLLAWLLILLTVKFVREANWGKSLFKH
jgi:membrane-associated PAP2 superfamily phosphatase